MIFLSVLLAFTACLLIYQESLQADKEKKIPLLLQRRLERVSAREKRPVTTFVIRQMGLDNIFTCDHGNVQAILATKFKHFELGAGRRHTLYPMFGVGIFTSDGETWSRSRALLPMRAMSVDPVTGWTSTIQAIMFRLTIDSVTEFLFGESAGSQAEALRRGGTLPFNHFSGDFDRGQCRAVVKRVHEYVDRFVHAALTTAEDRTEKSQSSSYVFLEALAASTKDPIELRSQLLNIPLAGRDTTASLLSWSLLMLARHPKVFTKLRAVILADFGSYTSSRDKITFASLKSCRYLQYFLNEVLRLYPAVPINRRVATTATTLPNGGGPAGNKPIYLRAGQVVTYSPFVTHRRTDLWGDDAEVFNPERWVNRKVGWEYLPFNGGPRVCIGQQFALPEAGYVIVRLLQRFDAVLNCYPEREIRYGLTLTLAPADGVLVRLHAAE
ncbi:cytochrome P450 [Aspergillus foveolatus]|uniref:cytochrome P450 n=1 Tax=Aspergillus foveolatus TaxID=210207 RepID=UPI003CCDEDA6